MKLLGGIKKLLHDDGMTIKGVQKLLREQGVAHVSSLSMPLGDAADDVIVDASPAESKPATEPAKAPESPKSEEPVESIVSEPQTPLTFTRHTAPEPEAEKTQEPAAEDTPETVPELPSFTYLRGKDTPPKSTDDAPTSPEHLYQAPNPQPLNLKQNLSQSRKNRAPL